MISSAVATITAVGFLRGFTKQYGLKQLVYFEQHDDVRAAIQREMTIKHWPMSVEGAASAREHPDCQDLPETLV